MNKNIKTFKTDISKKKEFDRAGYHYKLVNADESSHIYLYSLSNSVKNLGYELVRAVPHINPDGSLIHIYPSSEQFGLYGYYIVGNEDYCKQRIQYRTECLKQCNFKLEKI